MLDRQNGNYFIVI